MIEITSSFDGGNIEVLKAGMPNDIRLRIKNDNQSDFFQWFYFRLTGAANCSADITIENAGESAYPEGWENYSACASYDRQTWFRIPTGMHDGKLVIRLRPESG